MHRTSSMSVFENYCIHEMSYVNHEVVKAVVFSIIWNTFIMLFVNSFSINRRPHGRVVEKF